MRQSGFCVRTLHSALFTLHLRVVEPEVVATSPNRIKSPVPVCCGFSSQLKWLAEPKLKRAKVGARGRICTCTGDALNVVSLLLDYASGWRRANMASAKKWILQPVMLRQNRFTKAIRRLLRGGNEACRAEARGRAKVGRNPECCPRRSWLMKPA